MLECFAIRKHLLGVLYAKMAYVSPRLTGLTYFLRITPACAVLTKFLGGNRILFCHSRCGLFYVVKS